MDGFEIAKALVEWLSHLLLRPMRALQSIPVVGQKLVKLPMQPGHRAGVAANPRVNL